MTLVRFAVCAALAGALALPASAFAQGPNHRPGSAPSPGAMAVMPPPPPLADQQIMPPPCWVGPDAAQCLTTKLQAKIAKHRLRHDRAALLRRRIKAAQAQEKQARDAYKRIETELHGG